MDARMDLIQSLDQDAHTNYSWVTRQYYVTARIEIGDGVCLTSICEHRATPDEAIDAYLDALKRIDLTDDAFLVTTYKQRRREWRWNGSAFVECTREERLDAHKS